VAYSDDRAHRFDFHRVAVLSSWSQVYARADVRIESFFDLRNKRVAVLEGSSQETYLRDLMTSLDVPVQLVTVSSLAAGFQAAKEGQVVAIVANQRYGDMHAFEYKTAPTPIVFQPANLFVAATKGRHADVLAAIDAQLIAWKQSPDSRYFQILRHWTHEPTKAAIPPVAWLVLQVIVAALLVALLWIYTLRLRVARVTHDLHASRDQLNVILDSVGAYVYIKDTDLRYVYANRPVLDLFGHKLPDVIGMGDDAFFDTETTEKIRNVDRRVMASGQKLVEEEINRGIGGGPTQTFLSVKLPLKRKDGEIYALCGISTDLTELRKVQNEIHALSYYDTLTHLPNRRLLIEWLQQSLDTHRKTEREGAVILLDLAQLSLLNTTRGHDAGDNLLVQAAKRIQTCARSDEPIARLGSDEFAILLLDLSPNKEEAARHVQNTVSNIQAAFVDPFLLPTDYRHTCAVVMGVALFSDTKSDAEGLLKLADIALHQAKGEGPSSIRFYNEAMHDRAQERARLVVDLRGALDQDEFFLAYQPQVGPYGELLGAEALLRWRQPGRGVRMPGEFIEATEASGLIVPLGHWVLQAACEQIAKWQTNPDTRHWRVAVNISARQFRHDPFVTEVLEVLRLTGAPPHLLELELTETQLLDDLANVTAKMHELRALGITFALDDFGTGYSSLAYLRHLPLSRIKIDKSFVDRISTDPHDQAIVRTIYALAQNLNLVVIAEGVETEAQRACLLEIGEMEFQGYLFGRPKSPEAMVARFGGIGT
jgi:diguanylate cyclase (GGDEF)-like protein/PAS domain S-box-containing protein